MINIKVKRQKGALPLVLTAAMLAVAIECGAQRQLSLDSCRVLALRNNKQLGITKANREMAENVRKAARTNYLPKLDAVGTYQLTSREVSLLSKDQQNRLNNLGTNAIAGISGDLSQMLPDLVQQGLLTASQAQTLGSFASQIAPGAASSLNNLGSELRKALRTNTRNLFAADIVVRQPLYMGGAIIAENKMADINVRMAGNSVDALTQNTLYDVDNAYWLVVSLRQKQILADDYLALVRKFHADVQKMLTEGVATRSDELRVAVRENEAEMQQTQVDDGLVLARMHLCEIIGIELNSDIHLDDEDNSNISSGVYDTAAVNSGGYDDRPELQLLQNHVDLSMQNVKLARAVFLPKLLLTGGYMTSNPNLLDGYQDHFSGMFHVGLTLQVPVWNWGEGRHKVRAAKSATTIARLEYDDAREKIGLQVQQAEFRVKEAYKKLNMATHNLTSAEENLRCANLGFKEGIMQTTDVMEAQTAWQNAHSQEIDAQIDVKMSYVNLQKAKGTLRR